MVEVNGSESLPKATNQTLSPFTPFGLCTGPSPPISVKITIYSVLMSFSLIGNLSVVAVFYRNKTLRTTVHYFIVNMAISDLIMPLIYLPWVTSKTCLDGLWLVDGILGTILCKLVVVSWGLSLCVSVLSMLGIAADRFHAIVLFFMKSALFSQNKRRLIIAATWVASVAFRTHFLYAAKLVPNNNTGHLTCTVQWEPASYTSELYRIKWMLLFSLTAVSVIVLTVLYSSILFFSIQTEKQPSLGI